jgi:thiol:disulfide interchange protein
MLKLRQSQIDIIRKKPMLKHLLALFLFTISFFLFADEEIPEKPVETTLQQIEIEGKKVFALSYKNHPHWHTYWKNPGDAGLPTEIKPHEFEITEFPWPTPKRFIEKGDILAYGYDGTYTRFFEIPSKSEGDLKLESTWLVCKHVCIPGKIDINFTLSNGNLASSSANDFQRSDDDLKKAFESLPQKGEWPNSLDIVLKKGSKENQIIAFYNYPNHGGKELERQLGMLTPYRQELLDITREHLYKNAKGNLFGKMNIAWDGEYVEPTRPFPADGKFTKPVSIKFLWQNPIDSSISIVEKEFTSFDLQGSDTNEGLLKSMSFLKPSTTYAEEEEKEEAPTKAVETQKDIDQSLLTILLFAFLGGLILNIMPCVLPVISLKLFGLVIHSDESRGSILRHNIFYTLGVLSTFLILAIAIVVLKSTGENVGWGFQLQSPVFVALMIVVLFVFALNLFGLYEFATPGGKTLGNMQLKKGMAGDFLGGVLATILSTPCSAPFLGTALTFAFTASTFEIILTFQAIGLGLAFPFLMTGIFPGTIKFLPKPGMWMESVKKFLGLTLLLTAIWLVDVFVSLTSGNVPLMKLNTGLILLFFAFYYQKHISKKMGWRSLFFVFALLPFLSLFTSPLSISSENSTGETDLIREKNHGGEIIWESWSEEKMESYKSQGELVFIDFTAKWCFTCKVNEKLVLDTDGFRNLVKEKNIKLLLGDWTKYDPVIGAFLKKHGYVGVPAYFIQKPDGTLVKLGETITLSKIEKNL